MNNSLLANIRWLCLPSDDLGADWFDKSRAIDGQIEAQGFDLSEESVYLLFTESPDYILEGEGHCLVARPVIGPLKEVSTPFQIIDWRAAPVWQEKLQGETLEEILISARDAKEKAVKGTRKFKNSFYLKVKRELRDELLVSVEGIFHE
jgi:hypothetical protein